MSATRHAPPESVYALPLSTDELSECGEFSRRFLLEPGREALGADVLGMLTLSEPPPLFVSLAFGNRTVATRRIDATDGKGNQPLTLATMPASSAWKNLRSRLGIMALRAGAGKLPARPPAH